MKNAIVTIFSGEHGSELSRVLGGRHSLYASKCGAEYEPYILTEKQFCRLMMQKMWLVSILLKQFDRVLWIDADILIHRDSPNLFDIVPPDAFSAVDECSTANDLEVYERHQHLAKTCTEEGLPIPDTKGRYFNCGMFLAGKQHQSLFAPRRTLSEHNWCEQSLVNARLMLAGIKTVSLPECFNRFVYWGMKPRRFAESSYFLHYAGAPSHQQRIRDMRQQSAIWGDL